MSYIQSGATSTGRISKITERSRLHQIDMHQKRRSNLEARIRTQLVKLDVLVEEQRQAELLDELDTLEKLFAEFMKCHSKCLMLIAPNYDEFEAYSTDSIDRKVTVTKRKAIEVLDDIRVEKASTVPEKKSVKSSSKSSSSKSKSSSSGDSNKSVTSEMAKEKARLAELQIEAKFLKQKQRMEQESKAFQLNLEMAKTQAKIEAYKIVDQEGQEQILENLEEICPKIDKFEFVNDYVRSYVIPEDSWLPVRYGEKSEIAEHRVIDKPAEKREEPLTKNEEQPQLVNHGEEFVVKSEDNIVRSPVDGSVKIDEIIRQIQAPPVEMGIFSGNCIDYPYFMSTFAEVVESKVSDPRGRLVRLIQYLQDEAKELVESCSYLPAAEGYERAKDLLKRQYGDQYRILSQYRKELKQWPKLKSHDAKGFRRFYSFLMKYKATMLSLKSPSIADSPELLQKLQLVLPPFLQERWNRRSFQVRKKRQVEAGLDEFILFVEEETSLINDPTYSKLALQDFKDEVPPKYGFKKDIKSFLTSSSSKQCQICDKPHDLDKCGEYLKLPVDERRKLLYRKRLCFGCYGPSSESHHARTCRKRRTCDTCGGNHPTGLHGYKRRDYRPKSPKPQDKGDSNDQVSQPEAESNDPTPLTVTKLNFAKLDMEVTSLNVVSVRLTHPSSQVVVNTKALLDSGSQGTFIHESLLERFKILTASTSISIKTMSGVTTEPCQSINNLEVSPSSDPNAKIHLPKTFSRRFIPVDEDEIPFPKKIRKWKYLDGIHPFLPQEGDDLDVGILIGGNCPRALEPIEVIPCQDDGPYAFRSVLGWCVTGPIFTKPPSVPFGQRCNFVTFAEDQRPTRFIFEDQIKENGLKEAMLQMLHQDFSEKTTPNDFEKMSIEDKRFLKLMDEEVKFSDGHYELPLPLKNPDVKVPNNRIQAVKRARSLKRKLQKDEKMYSDYCTFMNKLFEKSYARKVSDGTNDGKTWYLPHHGVYHPKKPDKIRVVFDCSATYGGMSLNSMLLQGPDLTNQIVGVLSRFREEQIALVADIESMFYQVRVPVEQQDMLRFIWWPEGNLAAEPEDYVMCVHLFGGTHSPSTCNYALRKTAIDNESKFGKEAASTLIRNFYVDDMLKGGPTVKTTVSVYHNTKGMCGAGGFNLTQFMSNSREVLDKIPEHEKAKGIKDVNLSVQSLPIERALGVSWCVETDSFCFRIVLKDTPLTRRGILASISSVYDPLGFGAPFVLPAKQLLQQLCSEHKSWDDDISHEQRQAWEKWRSSLPQLEKISIQRCIVPSDFGEISEVSFHHFSDASTSGYGQVSYARLVNRQGKIHCAFMLGKARVAPLKPTTVPRLELTAATTSTRVATQLKKEVTLEPDFETFWTDSKVVLGYISNSSKKFHLFVTNRIQTIHDGSDVQQWRYVPSDDNPSDDGSRGQSVDDFIKNQRWIRGPEFLWKPLKEKHDEQFAVHDNDVEIKKTSKCLKIGVVNDQFEKLFQRASSWYRLKRVIATILSWRYKKKIDVDLLMKAELATVRLAQKGFQAPIEQLKKGMLSRMDPFVDDDGIIRVGGRITNSTLPWKLKHPAIMPKKHRVSSLLIRHFHEKIQHGGRDATLNEIRQNGLMIVNANSRVRNEIFKCVTCRRFRGKFGEQKMANLPSERCSESAPFTYSGVDMFGPFIIKQGRKELKRYVALFTCFASRAIHLESTSTLDTDSFIMALRRFINRRGDVRQIRSDNGSNFVGANAEFKKAIKEMDQEKINDFLLRNNIDWMGWDFNTPTASHMGGVWERQIRSCRSILSSLLKNHSQSLNDESFYTVLTEVETIVNSRPLSVEVLSDSNSLVPLTPNQLLTSKTKIVMAPPGTFTQADIYSRRRWRRVQHLVNEFWSRWRSEYLQSLQSRRKWTQPRRNFAVNDVVLLKDDATQRNDWRLGRVVSVKTGEDQNVRSVVVQTSTHREYERPISKIVLLVEAEINRIPDKEPTVSE